MADESTHEALARLNHVAGVFTGLNQMACMQNPDNDAIGFQPEIDTVHVAGQKLRDLSDDVEELQGALRHHKREAEAKAEERSVLITEMDRKLTEVTTSREFHRVGYDNLMDVLVDAIEAVDLTLDDLEMAKSKGALKAKHAGILNPSISHLRDRQKRFNEVFEHHIKRRVSLSQAVIDNYQASKENADEE